ncbi:MAG: response regulator transcription factor [Bryobacteraceae bacterium]
MNEQTQENRIRLMLLESRVLFRAGLSRLLASQLGLEIMGECGSPAEALEMLHASPVDVVLLGPGHATERDGFIAAARRGGYQGRFLIVADAADARHSALAIRLGASGIFLTSEAPERLVRAITLVANGAFWLDRRVIQLLADQSAYRPLQMDDWKSRYLLSERQQKVLLGILEGLTNGRIAGNLGVSERAVKLSVQQLFLKAGVRKRSQLVRAALEGSFGNRQGANEANAKCNSRSISFGSQRAASRNRR